MKKNILIFLPVYLPGIKAGGPIRSIEAIISYLKHEYNFYIFTSDRDLGDKEAYRNVITDKWIKKESHYVFYSSPNITSINLIKIIKDISPYKIYLNSFFNYKYSIRLAILKKIGFINSKILLAPRGEFSDGALKIKNKKKKFFLKIARVFKIYREIEWHATSKIESEEIKFLFGANSQIEVAQNLTKNDCKNFLKRNKNKERGKLDLIFISRIHPKKNLEKAIMFLEKLKGNINFNIYGPIEDKNYWYKCKKMIELLPHNIQTQYHDVIEHKNVYKAFNKNHFFLFPTHGENFGHVIAEALINGCPVIISNKTPWKDLDEKKIGWDIGIDNEEKFVNTIQYCVDMGQVEYSKLSNNAHQYGLKNINSIETILKYKELLDY